jgi:hypothetical protein
MDQRVQFLVVTEIFLPQAALWPAPKPTQSLSISYFGLFPWGVGKMAKA